MTGSFNGPEPQWGVLALKPGSMGQDLLNPPTVEGWHTGGEWINSGALINRVNFVADRLRDTSSPGVQAMARRIGNNGGNMTTDTFVDRCLYEMDWPRSTKRRTDSWCRTPRRAARSCTEKTASSKDSRRE